MKNKTLFVSVSVFILGLIMLLGSSYSLMNSVTTNESYGFNVGNFDVFFQDRTEISLSGVPTEDTDGLNSDNEFTFTVMNNSDYTVNYRLDILENGIDEMKKVIKYSYNLNDSGYIDIYLLKDNYTIIQNKVLEKGEMDTYKVKMWLDINADERYMNKVFSASINLSATENEYKYGTSVIESLYNKKIDNVIKENNNYRYNKEALNNYIWFNCQDNYTKGEDYCEKWRIIGSFDNTWEQGIGIYKSLKIINTDYLDEINYNNEDKNGKFDNSYINTYLNGAYYDRLNDNTKKLILKAKWDIGDVTTDDYYKTLNDEKKNNYYAYVGLLNVSDYLFLGNSGWIKNKTLFINKNGNRVNYLNKIINYLDSKGYYNYLPVMYLKPDISFVSGDGSINNPYELGVLYPMTYGVK